MKAAQTLATAMLCVSLLAATGYAQSASGQITGTVTDSTGAVVPNATVTVSNQSTGLTRTTSTTDSGTYSFPFLPVGTYSVSLNQTGFRPAKRTDISLNVDQVVRADIQLEVGAVTEAMVVTASGVQVDTESSSVGQVVNQRQVSELPLNGRNFLQLLFIGTGAVETTGEQGVMRQGQGNAISINGSRPTSNNYMLDGLVNTDVALNTPAVVLSVDAIQEFKEQTATYSAEYGFSANQINIVSKSGTNDLHGSMFWFGRNNFFDARSTFQDQVAILRQNQFGFVAGGPVYMPKVYNGHNKTFWLANYEGWRIRQGLNQFGNVPDPNQLAGKFTQPVIDPTTGAPFSGGGGFASVIPSGRFSRMAQTSLQQNIFPAANCLTSDCQGNYRLVTTLPNDTNQQTYKLDQNLGRFGTIFARGTVASYTSQSLGTNTLPLGFSSFDEHSTSWMVSHTLSSGRNVNQFRFGRLNATTDQGGYPISQSVVDALGFSGVFPNLTDPQRVFPNITFGNTKAGENLSAVGGAVNAYSTSNQPMWDFSDGMTLIRGRHTFGLGAEYRRWQLNRDVANNFLGNYTFSSFFSGNEVADFLLGYFSAAASFQPSAFSIPGVAGNPRQYNFQYFAPYVQDDWKVTSRLTVNLGLRWDFRTIPNETRNRMGWLDTTNKLGGMCIADQSLVDKGIAPPGNAFYRYCGRTTPVDSNMKPFAPRIGFAFRPFGGAKTVIRGGYGIFYDSFEGREIDGAADIYPYVSRTAINQAAGQANPLTTNQLFPVFSAGPVTPAVNSFLAVLMSDYPRSPYVQQWSLSVQRQLTSTMTLEVNYIGNKGTHLLTRRNIAQALPPDPANPTPVAARKAYPNFGVYINSDWNGYSSYNSGNIKFERRTASTAITAVYTWAKSLDDKSAAAGIGVSQFNGWQGFLDNHNPSLDYGRSDFDVDHRFVSSFVVELPVGRGKRFAGSVSRAVNAAIGGWQLNGILTLQRGFPSSIIAADTTGLLDSFGNNRANLVGDPYPSGFHRTRTQWFNTAAFQQPADNRFGTSGRNVFRLPGINNWDIGVSKNMQFTERTRLQLRLETFNAFNHPQFGQAAVGGGGAPTSPVLRVADPRFGQITSARPGRIAQLGAKFVF